MEIFWIVPGSLGLCLSLGFDPGADCLRVLLCVIVGKMNNMLFVWSKTEFFNCYLML